MPHLPCRSLPVHLSKGNTVVSLTLGALDVHGRFNSLIEAYEVGTRLFLFSSLFFLLFIVSPVFSSASCSLYLLRLPPFRLPSHHFLVPFVCCVFLIFVFPQVVILFLVVFTSSSTSVFSICHSSFTVFSLLILHLLLPLPPFLLLFLSPFHLHTSALLPFTRATAIS